MSKITPEIEAYLALMFCCCGDWRNCLDFKFTKFDNRKLAIMLTLIDQYREKLDSVLARQLIEPVKPGRLEDKIKDLCALIPPAKRIKVLDKCQVIVDSAYHPEDQKVMHLIKQSFGLELSGIEYELSDPLEGLL